MNADSSFSFGNLLPILFTPLLSDFNKSVAIGGPTNTGCFDVFNVRFRVIGG